MKSQLSLVFALVALAPVSRAQQASPTPGPSVAPLPAGALLKRAPDFSSWIVTYASSKPTMAQSPAAGPATDTKGKKPARMAVTKTGQNRHVVAEEADGSKGEVWCEGALEVFVRPEWKQPLLADGANRFDALFVDFSRTDFPGLEWVNARTYTGIQKYAGRDCIIFQDKLSMSDNPAPAKATPPALSATGQTAAGAEGTLTATACVDLDTRLPVVLRRGDEVTTYQFDKPPEAPLVFPPEVQEVFEARAKRIHELGRKPGGGK